MNINFENEVNEIISNLKPADGYLECENVILSNIKKQFANEIAVQVTENYLRELLKYFQELTVKYKDTPDCRNYRYAEFFLKTLISTPYWPSWIK